MAKLKFKEIFMALILGYGFLWALDAIGLLTLLSNAFGSKLGGVELLNPYVSMMALFAVALLTTFMAVAMSQNIKDKKFLPNVLMLAVVLTLAWVYAPTILPKVLQQFGASAQSMLSSGAPQAIMIP